MMNESTSTSAAAAAGGSGHAGQGSASSASREELITRRNAHQKELERLSDEMRRIQELCRSERQSIQELTRQLGHGPPVACDDEDADDDAIVNYFGQFCWSERMKEQMESVFGIKSFRLAQEGCVRALLWRRCTPHAHAVGDGKQCL